MTVLNSEAEWHALGIGAGAGFVAGITGRTGPLLTLAEYAIGGRDPSEGHLADLDDEAAYALSGMIAGFSIGREMRPGDDDYHRR